MNIEKLLSKHPTLDISDNVLTRIRSMCKHHRVKTAAQLATRTERELMLIPNFGPKCTEAVKRLLAHEGLVLKEEGPNVRMWCPHCGQPLRILN